MSEAADLLESYSKSAPTVAQGKSATQLLQARASGDLTDDDLSPPESTVWQNMYDMEVDRTRGGGGEALASLATGAASAIPAGLHGLYSLWMGQSPSAAAEAVHGTQEAMTYQPRDPVEAQTAQQMGDVLNFLPQHAGRFAGETAERFGAPPEVSAMLDTAGQMAVPVGLAKGLKFAGERISPLLELPTEGMQGRGNMGAAASVIEPERLSKVPPEVRKEIQTAYQQGAINREAAERAIDAESLPVPIRLTRGEIAADPELISHERNNRARVKGAPEFYDQRNQGLIQNLDEIRAQAAPEVVHRDSLQNGQALIDAYKDMDAPVRADINAKYKALEEANGGEMPISGKSFVEAADVALARKFKSKRLPSEIRSELDELRETGNMTFQQFEELRTSLATDARKAERSGDGNAATAIRLVRDALESIPMEGAAGDLKALADSARKAAKMRFDRLDADPAYRAAIEDDAEVGQLSPEADKFITKYVVGGKAAHIQRMRENLAGNEQVPQILSVSALNQLRKAAGIKDVQSKFNQPSYNNALRDLSPKIEYLMTPETAEMAHQLGRVANTTQFQKEGSFVNNSNTFVAAAGEGAKSALEGIVNLKSGGIPVGSWARRKLETRSAEMEWQESINPGSKARLSSLLETEKKK